MWIVVAMQLVVAMELVAMQLYVSFSVVAAKATNSCSKLIVLKRVCKSIEEDYVLVMSPSNTEGVLAFT